MSDRVGRRHSARSRSRTAPARSRRAVPAALWRGERAGTGPARRRHGDRARSGSDRARPPGRLLGRVAAPGVRGQRGRGVARSRATTTGAPALDRCPRCAAASGLSRDGGSCRRSGQGRRGRRRWPRHLHVRRRHGRHHRRGGGGLRSRRRRRARSRRRRRGRFRSRRRRRRWSRWRCGGGRHAGREQRGGIDVRVAVAAPDAEVDVARVVLRVPGRPGGGNRRPLRHDVAPPHEQRADMRQRGPVPVVGRNGHGQPVGRHGPGEGDLARRGCPYARCVIELDVEATMLPARVRVVAEREGAQDRPVRRPAPGRGVGRSRERAHERRRRDEQLRCR